jgi:CRISPR/Cas system endoribonuclease Cas6 (RAMP superfamily)
MPARAALLEQPRRRCPEAVATRSAELRWVDWERYSARQDTRMTLGGFMGTATFAGELDVFMPLLRLGEVVHVGKGTAFGLGKYRLTGWPRLEA